MLSVNNVTKIYHGGGAECAALRGINLELSDKGLVFIEGRSGSGKTTLLNIIAGIDSPTEGTVENFGKNSCAMIFQDFQLIDMLTVRQNLELVQNIMPNAQTGIDELAEKYELTELLNKYPNQISGGQKQRVAVLRAVLENRPIIVCDEPTGNLDEENAKKIAELLKSESSNKLILVVSHDTEIFKDVCDRHIKLKSGVIESDTGLSADERNNSAPAPESVVKIGFKAQSLLSWKIFKKNLGKNIMVAVALLFSFALLLSALNGLLNTEGRVIYNVHKKEDGGVIELALKDGQYDYLYGSMGEDDYVAVEKHGNTEARFVDLTVNTVGNEHITRMFVADYCKREMLCGSNNTAGRTAVISDYIADKLLKHYEVRNYEELLGKAAFEDCTVVGVYRTIEQGVVVDDSDPVVQRSAVMERVYSTAYISYETMLALNGGIGRVYAVFNDKGVFGTQISSKAIYTVECGEKTDLTIGTIALGSLAADCYTKNHEELIGQTVTIEFVNCRNDVHLQPYKSTAREFKVTCVVSGGYNIVVSEEDYNAVMPEYGAQFFGVNTWGVRLNNCSKSGIQKLVNYGYTDASYLAGKISSGISWLKPLTYIELAVGAVLLIISIIILCNHIGSLIDKEKRTLGVLVSLGLKVRQTVFAYLLGTVCVLLCSFILSAAVAALGVVGLNAIMLKFRISAIKVFFYEPLSILCVFAVFAVLTAIIYAVLVCKLRKKQIVDIIYER